MWIAKSLVSFEARDRSLDSASCEAKIVSDCKIISALHIAKPRLSREAKVKAPLCANSASLSQPTPSAKVFSRETRTKALSAKDLSREVKNKVPLSANSEAILASLKGGALHSKAKLAFKAELK